MLNFKTIICLVFALLSSGCIEARIKHEKLSRSDEDGNICDILLGDIALTNKSCAFLLGKIIQHCSTNLPGRSVHVYLYERDRRVIEVPTLCNVLSNADFMAIAASPTDNRQTGPLNGNWSHPMLQEMIDIVGAYSGAHVMDSYSNPKKLCFYVGPEEIVNDGWKRQAYRVPELLKSRLPSLPSVLPARGACMGFSPEKNLLVVIDGEQQNVFRLLSVMGFEPIEEGNVLNPK